MQRVSPPAEPSEGKRIPVAHPFDVEDVRLRLAGTGGGYEIVHETSGLELGVYVLNAPDADHQEPHAYDEVYVVLEGRGTLEIEGERVEVQEGKAAFVPAGADHRFVGYEHLSLLVIFDKGAR
jgi:mannose-6-phosphate isomerase-like protein (cupin superfamily)